MAATHHFYRHNRPLPIVQILNDGSFFSQRHVAFLLRRLLISSKATFWFALTAISSWSTSSSLELKLYLLSDTAAAHHFYGHNRPLPIAQILNDGSFFSQRHVAFLLRLHSQVPGSLLVCPYRHTIRLPLFSRSRGITYYQIWRQLIISMDTTGLYLLCRF
jgi:hypothetical protein